MLEPIPALCEAVLTAMERLGSPVRRYLNEGAGLTALDALSGTLNGELSPPVSDLFGWHDGTTLPPDVPLADLWLVPGYYLLSIERALSHRNDAIDWPTSWLPLFANDGGDYLIVDGKGGEVVRHISHEEPMIIHRDLRAFLLTTLACFEAGAAFAEPDGFIGTDTERERAVARRMNPDVDSWKDPSPATKVVLPSPTSPNTVSMWKRTTLRHSVSGAVDLYATESEGFVEVAIAGVDKKGRPTWFEHDRLKGALADLRLDQRGTPVPWQDVDPPTIENPVNDMLQARQRNRHEDGLNYLRYELGNAINAAQGDPGFARRAKKLMVGTWRSTGMSITFRSDGTYSSEAIDASSVLVGAPLVGRWNVSSNMFWLMSDDKRGVRCQLVDIDSNVMVLPGEGGALRYVLERASDAPGREKS